MDVKAIKYKQGTREFFVFTAKAKDIWDRVDINRKEKDKDEGYQRALSPSRANDIKKYIIAGHPIIPAIIIALDKAAYDEKTQILTIPDDPSSGWVIDGQHRLRGAQLAALEKHDIELAVVASIGMTEAEQILQFVTINKEAKGVPTSLYYDLLKFLPHKKTAAEIAKEKAAAIAEDLRKNKESLFFEKIVIVTSPQRGELSLTNFVRKTAPLLTEGKGFLSVYSQQEVSIIIQNYFVALKSVFPDEFSFKKERFFQTLGFGAVMNAFDSVFLHTTRMYNGFRAVDAERVLQLINDFQFNSWDNIGTGSAAEIQAGRDLRTYLEAKIKESGSSTTKVRLS